MINKVLPAYTDISILNSSQIQKLTDSILYFDELIIDPTNFLHPGTTSIISNWHNKDISTTFQNRKHSFNGKLMLLNLVIGRKSDEKGRGYELYSEVKQSKMLTIHDKLMSELDLKYGLLDQLSKRTVEEMEVFVTIPKYYKNTQEIMFKNNRWEDFLYRENFLLSNTVFTLVLIYVAHYLFTNSALLSDITKIFLFLLGILTWTGLEYYFHRIVLHEVFLNGKILRSHYIHHAFPNMRDKLTLSIVKNLVILWIMYIIGLKIVQIDEFNLLNFLLGLHFFMTLYDILHYYFHFGWEMNIPILNQLRKNHMKHHYQDMNKGFGVTTTLWDWVFGTRYQKQ